MSLGRGGKKFREVSGVDELNSLLDENNLAKTGDTNPFIAMLLVGLLCVVGGILMSAVALPLVFAANGTVNAADGYWESLPKELQEPALPQKSVIVDINGSPIATFYSENRELIKLENVSDNVVDALIASEDSRFFEHNGVDLKGVGRALLNNARGGQTQGASTITQQLVKNTLLMNATTKKEQAAAIEQTFTRKIEELSLAVSIESEYSKEEILEQYLNISLFSNAVYGIGTASKYYFDIPASELSVPQSAMLIALLKNPTGYNPLVYPEAALERRNVVLGRMRDIGKITPQEFNIYKNEPLGVVEDRPQSGCNTSPYPHFCTLALEEALKDPRLGETTADRERKIYLGGLTIRTTLDPELQDVVQNQVVEAMGLDNRVAAGVAVVEPGTGKILAMGQNRLWGKDDEATPEISTEINLVANSSAPSGSTFKVFALVAALENGMRANDLVNAPAIFNPPDMNVPKGGITNLSRAGTGLLSINDAIAVSSNTYFAELQREVGVLTVAEYAAKLGVETNQVITSRDSSYTLGTTSTSSLDMAGAYAAFVANGVYCTPHVIVDISHVNEGVLPGEGIANCNQAISADTARIVRDALISGVDGEHPSRTSKRASLGGYPAGGKTGTVADHAATWFVGITPNYATSVWLGDPRGGFRYPLTQGVKYHGRTYYRVYGSDIAAPLWKEINEKITGKYPDAQFSSDSSTVATSNPVNAIPNIVGLPVGNALNVLDMLGVDYDYSGVVDNDKTVSSIEMVDGVLIVL